MTPVWIDTTADLVALVDRLLAEPRYAMDTEFHRERTYYPRLALVQLAWPGGTALVDPLALDITELARLLDGPGLAVLHAAQQDLDVLTHACGTVPARLFDTQLAAGFLGYSTPSLSTLVSGAQDPPPQGGPAHRLAAAPAHRRSARVRCGRRRPPVRTARWDHRSARRGRPSRVGGSGV